MVYREAATNTVEHPLIPVINSQLELANNKRQTFQEIEKQKKKEKEEKETARLTKLVLKAIELLPENVADNWRDRSRITLYYKPFGFWYKKRIKLPRSYPDSQEVFKIAKEELKKLGYDAYTTSINDSYSSTTHYEIGVVFKPKE
jgi:hypothetical protein